MLGRLQPTAPDKILKLMAMFRDDPRINKVDLGVGVYRSAEGTTPVLRAVAEAEAQILRDQTTKSYTALAGDPAFHQALGDLVLGDTADWSRIAAIATPGGTGAFRQAIELVRRTKSDGQVWVPDPSWPNHAAILSETGTPWRSYRYVDRNTGMLDRDGMLTDLQGAKRGDVVLLHGCCHNPTGVDLDLKDWDQIAAICEQTGAMPLIDIAYQGFGRGLEQDAQGVRLIASRLPEALIGASCSKNFGLYRERVGLLLALTDGQTQQAVTQGAMEWLNRLSYAFPPDHGARVVTKVLSSPQLCDNWLTELEEMRSRIERLRRQFAHALTEATGRDRYGYIERGKGMFCLLPATPDHVAALRESHGVYVIDDGRLNVAGLSEDTIPQVAAAIRSCGI
ncbi:aromatic amino acid transaminase [Qingshengfaniella alkalisoli]|uniref:Aminotransferase n=1 Tax=Qingshengfaniella alkalisoli TaxID=2599296 RepID=A0A5B8IXF4_9RHOB|nr:amino acid aminotransferase [Qingshengfaniella alkalisoli]QDY70323.1 aspartate/tyrosine/aromatic aminotransferase [Qingshengfaniella alkalisoli]